MTETLAAIAATRTHPRLRAVSPEWVDHGGQPLLILRDPLHLSDAVVAVPRPVAVLLSLFDGERDLPAIAAAYQLRSGLVVTLDDLRSLVRQLDETLLLEGPRATAAYQERVRAFRQAPARPPALAGRVYPRDPQALTLQLEAWLAAARSREPGAVADPAVRGVICPHIDYHRGAPVYADLWLRAAAAARAADVIVVFGTDHHGRAGSITPTVQRYATPHGAFATDAAAIDALVAALGEDACFAQELNHVGEHSIELALVWLQHCLDGKPTPVVPILTGSFAPFTDGTADAAEHAPFQRAISALRDATAGRRVLVVAAADLAHMGPAFGDPDPLDDQAKRRAFAADGQLLDALCTGSADVFLEPVKAEGDARRICGLSPIYFTLRMLGGASGEVTGYDQCPADATFGSLVSIAGVLLR